MMWIVAITIPLIAILIHIGNKSQAKTVLYFTSYAKMWLVSESIGLSGSILNMVIFPETTIAVLSGMVFGSIVVLFVVWIVWNAISKTD